jgi:hypothetical protein
MTAYQKACDDGVNYESNITVISHSRNKFYSGLPIHWYEFKTDGGQILLSRLLNKFLNVPDTKYYEYSGTHEEALLELTKTGITDIVIGDEL